MNDITRLVRVVKVGQEIKVGDVVFTVRASHGPEWVQVSIDAPRSVHIDIPRRHEESAGSADAPSA